MTITRSVSHARRLYRFYANHQLHQKCAFSLTDIFCAGGNGEQLPVRVQSSPPGSP